MGFTASFSSITQLQRNRVFTSLPCCCFCFYFLPHFVLQFQDPKSKQDSSRAQPNPNPNPNPERRRSLARWSVVLLLCGVELCQRVGLSCFVSFFIHIHCLHPVSVTVTIGKSRLYYLQKKLFCVAVSFLLAHDCRLPRTLSRFASGEKRSKTVG